MSSPVRIVTALIVNMLVLAVVIGGGGLLMVLARPALAVAWWVGGVLAYQALLWLALRKPPSAQPKSLAKTLDDLNATLEAQGLAIATQQQQIGALAADIDEASLHQRIYQELTSQTPRLAAVVAELAEAEESLPEALIQTRTWVAHARQLAAHTQAHLQALSEDIARR
jgi:hypothetical protein